MIQKICIIECLKMYKISIKLINFITKAIKNNKVELAKEQTLAEVKIQSGIVQRNSLWL